MPINYSTVDYIQNGQAITANTLNAPSVSLEARTDEVKRYSDQVVFEQAHTEDCLVTLVTDTPDLASIAITAYIREDGNTTPNLVKYYVPEFNSLFFSIYSEATHGGRYIIPGSAIGDLLLNAPENKVRANELTVPGDGIYAKIPLRHTGEVENLSNYPDLVYPKTKAQSIGAEYLTDVNVQALKPILLKLPELSVLDFASATVGLTAADFISAVQTAFSAHINAISTDSEGNISISDSNSASMSLKIRGTQEGAQCLVTRVLDRTDSVSGIIIEVAAVTAPIYIEDSTRLDKANLTLELFDNTNASVATATGPFDAYELGYLVRPRRQDPNFTYVPLIRLTENSLIIADRVIDLTNKTLDNGEVLNKYGSPIEAIDPLIVAEESDSYTVELNHEIRFNLDYKGYHSLKVPSLGLTNGIKNAIVENDLLKHISRNIKVGDKILFTGIRYKVTEEFVSSSGNTDDLSISARISTPEGNNIFIEAGNQLISGITSSMFNYGSSVELLPSFDNTYTVTANDVSDNNNFSLTFFIRDLSGGSITAGNVYLEVDLVVS